MSLPAPRIQSPCSVDWYAMSGDVAMDTGERPMMGKIGPTPEEQPGPEPVATPGGDVVQGGVEAAPETAPAPTESRSPSQQ